MNLSRLLTFPLTQCSVRARRLEMLQLPHSGCSCLLYLTFIGNINASTDHRRQISNVVGNGGYNFSAFLEANPGWHLWVRAVAEQGLVPIGGQGSIRALSTDHITFLHLCPNTSCPFPFLKILLSSWSFSSVLQL